MTTHVICIGSVLWDIIGRTELNMRVGHDVPGHITRIPGGVAYNIAQELTRLRLTPILLTSVGQDANGDALLTHCRARGMITDHVHISPIYSTDSYMAIEAANGLVAAIADAHSLEQVGDAILTPLSNGALGDENSPFGGVAIIDGNLTESLLETLAQSALLRACDTRIVPASPGKAHRLSAFFGAQGTTFYVNRFEAQILCDAKFETATQAADAMVAQGAARAIVTDGACPACDAIAGGETITSAVPLVGAVKRVTGAGDTLVAAHVYAELNHKSRKDALAIAVAQASRYVSGIEDDNV
jgi:pseudouridine kinase